MNQQAEKYLSTLDRLPNTLKTYRWALENYFQIAGDVLSDQAYKTMLLYMREQGYSPSTKRVMLSAVMGLYDFCEAGNLTEREKLNKHFTRKIKTKPVTFKRDKVETVIAYCETLRGDPISLRDRSFVLTLADTGFRISELAGLTRGDVDWMEERTLITGKGDKTAVVRLSHRSVAALRDYLQARAELDGKSGRPLGSLPLFAQHGNVSRIKAMTIDGMRKAIKQRMREAGIDDKDVRMHDFRHYFVTMVMLASGGNLKMAQELARHESTQTTQRYAHFTNSELDKNYDQIFNH